MVNLFEADDYIILNVGILFLLINFNLELGIIYLGMALIDWFSYYLAFKENVFKLYPMENNKSNRLVNIAYGIGAYVGFIFLTNFIVSHFATMPIESPFKAISSLIIGTFSATPILYGSPYLKLFVWGVLIPYVETSFFFRTLTQWGIHFSNASTIKFVNKLMISVFFGGIFTVFHIVAKGISNNTQLLVTFIFGVVSVLLILHFKEKIQAIVLHITTNSIAMLYSLGFIGGSSTPILPIIGMVVVTWFMLFHEIPLIKKISIGG
jgi:hypothetical protein